MSDAIDRAAKVIGDILQADPQIAHEMYGDEPDQIARALADAGLLAPAPLREEWAVKAEALREAADDLEAQVGDSGPGNRNTGYGRAGLDLIQQLRHRAADSVNRAEGDGRADEREPTVPASQLRAFARLCVDGGDMTPAAARMLDRIIDGDGRAEK